jgi:hypothetical protein
MSLHPERKGGPQADARAMPAVGATPARLLLGLLLAADGLFIVLHIAYRGEARLSLATDRGPAEIFQYVKEYWATALLLVLAVRHGAAVFVAWAAVFAYFLADDALMVHERIGKRLITWLELSPVLGIRAQDVGEGIVSITAACVLLAAITLAHRRAGVLARSRSRTLVRLAAALVAFGVGVDVIHEMIPRGSVYEVLTVVEDGGEMLVMSIVVAFVFAAVASGGSESPGRHSAA